MTARLQSMHWVSCHQVKWIIIIKPQDIDLLLVLLVSSTRSACSVKDWGSEEVPLLVSSKLELSLSEDCSAGVFWL